jgi:hypothetical protein
VNDVVQDSRNRSPAHLDAAARAIAGDLVSFDQQGVDEVAYDPRRLEISDRAVTKRTKAHSAVTHGAILDHQVGSKGSLISDRGG